MLIYDIIYTYSLFTSLEILYFLVGMICIRNIKFTTLLQMAFSNRVKIKSIEQHKKLRGKKVLMRCDFNVAIERGKVVDDFKIKQSLPTVRFLMAKGAKVILMTHLGRPGGKKVGSLQLSVISKRLSKLLDKKVVYVHDCTGKKAQTAVAKMKDKEIVLLENVRFYKGEESNDRKFAKALSKLADVYVNNAMASSHRAHASVDAIKKYLPSYAGILLEKEIENLHKVLHPQEPMIVIIGGAKIETKVPVIKNLSKKAEKVLIGGMISYDFLAAKGWSTGKYEVGPAQLKIAKKLLNKKVVLPLDFYIAQKKGRKSKVDVVSSHRLPADSLQFDIGPATIKYYSQILKNVQTIIWSGPMGMFENEHFKNGTLAIARLVATISGGKVFGVVGGGETVAALKQTKMLDNVDWVSTGGGAMLEYLAGNKMPGLRNIIK